MEQKIKQIQEAVLDMYTKVVFDEASHTYQNKATGEWLQGVSTVSSIVPKDWLSAWGAKEAVKALGFSDYFEDGDIAEAEAMLEKIKGITNVSDYHKLLKECKGASARKSKTALLDGSRGHEFLENYVKSQIRKTLPALMPAKDDMLYRPVQQFVEWAEANVAQWVLSEARVAYPEKGYAGTLDGLALMKDGSLAIVDFKFSSHISEDYTLQCSGYAACFEPYGIKIDKRIVVRLPKTLERDEWNQTSHTYTKIENTLEVKELDTPYEFDRDVFFHCLPVKRWINQMTKNK